MPQTLHIAAVQLEVTPAPKVERLARAGTILAQAAQAGAELAVLPELFNTGYAYTDENYALAEPLEGPTLAWMKAQAQGLNLHLAGSFLLSEGGEIYNSLLLVAPNGQTWRYDKRYPFIWERRYFRPGQRLCVADTDLGKIGLMICIDSTHRGLWRRYAGKVDLVVISSCPPHTGDFTYHLPSGEQFTSQQLGPLMRPMQRSVPLAFTRLLEEQARWLGVPVVNSLACGHFVSPLPAGRQVLSAMLLYAPWLARYLPQADGLQISAPMLEGCRVVGMDGQVLAHRTQAEGEGLALAEVRLPEARQFPRTPQPRLPVPAYAVWLSDLMASGQAAAYRKRRH